VNAFIFRCEDILRMGSRLRYVALLVLVVFFGLLPPHEEASPATNALAVSGEEITYNGSLIQFLSY
jgi:hypothetical protein